MIYIYVEHPTLGTLIQMTIRREQLETATRTLAHVLDFWAKDILLSGILPRITFELR